MSSPLEPTTDRMRPASHRLPTEPENGSGRNSAPSLTNRWCPLLLAREEKGSCGCLCRCLHHAAMVQPHAQPRRGTSPTVFPEHATRRGTETETVTETQIASHLSLVLPDKAIYLHTYLAETALPGLWSPGPSPPSSAQFSIAPRADRPATNVAEG